MILAITFPLLFGYITQFSMAHTATEKVYHVDQRDEILCSCVDFVRQYRTDAPSMNASEYVPTSATPTPQAIAVMRYKSGASHVAFVVSVTDTHVELLHANVVPCSVTRELMSKDNPRLLGYIPVPVQTL